MGTTRVMLGYGNWTDPLDPNNEVVEVELPPGYRRVYRGWLVKGDLYLDCVEVRNGKTVWKKCHVTKEEVAALGKSAYKADRYACVIRVGEPVDPPCDRCRIFEKMVGYRYCINCCEIVLGNLHSQESR